jgi:hypothetical protein
MSSDLSASSIKSQFEDVARGGLDEVMRVAREPVAMPERTGEAVIHLHVDVDVIVRSARGTIRAIIVLKPKLDPEAGGDYADEPSASDGDALRDGDVITVAIFVGGFAAIVVTSSDDEAHSFLDEIEAQQASERADGKSLGNASAALEATRGVGLRMPIKVGAALKSDEPRDADASPAGQVEALIAHRGT